ncbi:MAG: hypothetical protein PHE55_14405 [Methylococcaceae bacterium]|nr:hypothetical protein [Methylococcaceae bacterium]
MKTLIKNPRTRRMGSAVLMVLGGVLFFLAPEGMLFGWIFIALGVALEIAGTTLGHRGPH